MQRADRDVEFSEFYTARVRSLRRVAYVVTRDWHAAEDVTQRALMKVYRAWPRIERAGLEAYARRAVVNESLSYVTRRPGDVRVVGLSTRDGMAVDASEYVRSADAESADWQVPVETLRALALDPALRSADVAHEPVPGVMEE